MRMSLMKHTGLPSRAQVIRLTPYLATGLLLTILPPFLTSYVRSLLAFALINAIFAMSLNILMGYTGLVSLGHAVFYGTGAYVIGALMLNFNNNNFWISVPLVILITCAVAAVLGIVALRVSGLYFLLITFAFGQLLYSVVWNWGWLNSPGNQVITGIVKPNLGIPGFTWNSNYFYYFVFVGFVLCAFLIYRLVNSPFGRALVGIRECETRMRSLGYHVWVYKYAAFMIAGVFAGVAGMFSAYYNGMTVPHNLDVSTSAPVLLMVIIGGAGTLSGPFIGAIAMVFLQYIASIYFP